MTVFCYKPLAPAVCLGAKLRGKRQKQGASLDALARQTHIPSKYLLAIEQGAFNTLPKARAFRLAYVKEYAEALGFDRDLMVEQMIREAGLDDVSFIHPQTPVKQFPFASLASALRLAGTAALAILFVGYLGWQIKGIIQPPRLMVYSPFEGDVVNQLSALVQGETEHEARLTVNGQEIMVNEAGKFEDKIDLSPGVNTITVAAEKKHGKTTTVTRHLVVRPSKTAGETSLKETTNSDKVGL